MGQGLHQPINAVLLVAIRRKALGVRARVAGDDDCCDALTAKGAVHSHSDVLIETDVEQQRASVAHQLAQLLVLHAIQ